MTACVEGAGAVRWLRDDGRSAASLAALVRPGDRIDLDGIASALGLGYRPCASFVGGITRNLVPRAPSSIPARPLEVLLGDQLDGNAAYALSGGIDAALLVALARRRGHRPIAYTLRPRLARDLPPMDVARYDEHEAAIAIATRLGVELRLVDADDEAFRAALPAAVRAMETPIYNLHPVGRLILARRIAADGFTTLVTGDGADQRCVGSDGAAYLPLVGALVRSAGLGLLCPYLAPELGAIEGDPEKRALRTLLARDLPELAAQAKQPRLAPPIALEGLVEEARLAALAARLGPARLPTGDRLRVGLVSSALLASALEVD